MKYRVSPTQTFMGVYLPTFAVMFLTFSTPAQGEAPLEYNRDIRPILAENCFVCHGADSGSRKADLRLDLREAAVEYGAIVPGNEQESSLLERITTADPELIMPPPETKKHLTADQISKLQRWIAAGAEYQPHWSFLPAMLPELPAVKNQAWVKTPIDQFVLARLEAAGLSPQAEADVRTLFRRLHLDITGLPPEPQLIEAFIADYQKNGDAALSSWIDRLQASPRWGEHRARYWLDAARYGDTHGLHFDNYREMWPYRDWVIKAFNNNQPFDQFMLEQLAGDLLPQPTESQLIATGFQRCNITTNEGGTIDEENLALYAADRVQTFGWVFLGLTTNCSQCHDHKFDPITMKDYYSLAAYFRNTTQPAKDGNVKDGRSSVLILPAEKDRARWEALPTEIVAATKAREERKTLARTQFEQWLLSVTPEELDQDLPREGLQVHLPLNEGEGQMVSSLLNPADSYVATGEMAWSKGGPLGSAPVIQPGSTFDLGPAGDFEKDQPFSYGAWIKTSGDSNSSGIIARMDEQNQHRGWDLFLQGRTLAVHLIDQWPNLAVKVSTKDAVLKPNVWQHVFATYDGTGKASGVKIYVDGVEKPLRVDADKLPAEGSIRTATSLRLGQRSQNLFFADGSLQDVRIYERALSAQEVQRLAEVVTHKKWIALPAEKRKPEQTEKLFEYYLAHRDEYYPALAAKVVKLEAEQTAIRERSPLTHIQEERKDSPAQAHMLMRGEYDRPGELVDAATPAALHAFPEGAPKNRLGLAQWVIADNNPLTARVVVNRFWQQVFGKGIVVTSEDFGVMGMLPTHPELLDWLAVDFREHGWDVKRFFKQIFMSSAYRQASIHTQDNLLKDRDNALLSRGPRFRMDAEMIRDYALASSGLLSEKMYGPGVKPYQPDDLWNVVGLPNGNTREYVQDHGEDLYRRTVYSFWKRMAPPPNLEVFNAPSREFCTVRREMTNTPLQALVTLNDPQFVEAARYLAQSAMKSTEADQDKMYQYLGQRILGRPLSAQEISYLNDDLQLYRQYYQEHSDDAAQLTGVGESPVATELDHSELAAWTMICNQLLNLDEALSK